MTASEFFFLPEVNRGKIFHGVTYRFGPFSLLYDINFFNKFEAEGKDIVKAAQNLLKSDNKLVDLSRPYKT